MASLTSRRFAASTTYRLISSLASHGSFVEVWIALSIVVLPYSTRYVPHADSASFPPRTRLFVRLRRRMLAQFRHTEKELSAFFQQSGW